MTLIALVDDSYIYFGEERAYIQHDSLDFDSFLKFAVFTRMHGYFLFRYGWIEHHLLYRTV